MGTQGVEFRHRVLDAREPEDLALLAMALRLAPLLSPAGEARGGVRGKRGGEGGRSDFSLYFSSTVLPAGRFSVYLTSRCRAGGGPGLCLPSFSSFPSTRGHRWG